MESTLPAIFVSEDAAEGLDVSTKDKQGNLNKSYGFGGVIPAQQREFAIDIATGELRDNLIDSLNDYAENEWGIQLNDDQLKIVQEMVGVISEINI